MVIPSTLPHIQPNLPQSHTKWLVNDQVRTLSHSLNVESERWIPPIVKREDRMCHLRSSVHVQDEHNVSFESFAGVRTNTSSHQKSLNPSSQCQGKMIHLHFLMCNPSGEGCMTPPPFENDRMNYEVYWSTLFIEDSCWRYCYRMLCNPFPFPLECCCTAVECKQPSRLKLCNQVRIQVSMSEGRYTTRKCPSRNFASEHI